MTLRDATGAAPKPLYQYQFDTSTGEFELRYDADGWNMQVYRSSWKEWRTTD